MPQSSLGGMLLQACNGNTRCTGTCVTRGASSHKVKTLRHLHIYPAALPPSLQGSAVPPGRLHNGIDWKRLQLVLGVLNKHTDMRPYSSDVYVNVLGGGSGGWDGAGAQRALVLEGWVVMWVKACSAIQQGSRTAVALV